MEVALISLTSQLAKVQKHKVNSLLPLRLMLLMVASIGSQADGFARVGETLEECTKRYGEPTLGPIEGTRGDSFVSYCFEKSGFKIFASFHDGNVVIISFAKLENDGLSPERMQTDEILLLLAKNMVNGEPWEELVPFRGANHAAVWKNASGADASFDGKKLVIGVSAHTPAAKELRAKARRTILEDF
jgi:hypothetical protein